MIEYINFAFESFRGGYKMTFLTIDKYKPAG